MSEELKLYLDQILMNQACILKMITMEEVDATSKAMVDRCIAISCALINPEENDPMHDTSEESEKDQADQRRKDIENQLERSKYVEY